VSIDSTAESAGTDVVVVDVVVGVLVVDVLGVLVVAEAVAVGAVVAVGVRAIVAIASCVARGGRVAAVTVVAVVAVVAARPAFAAQAVVRPTAMSNTSATGRITSDSLSRPAVRGTAARVGLRPGGRRRAGRGEFLVWLIDTDHQRTKFTIGGQEG
jgi:hypothetical protein